MEFSTKLIMMFIIINVNTDLFSCCYLNCKCSKNNIDCRRMSLKQVPKDIPASVTYLDLSFNNINNLPNNLFVKLKNLKWLKLSNNEIKSIDENAFVGLVNLEDLFLEHNDLSYLHPEIFNKGLNNLLHVYLTGNEFETIPVLKATRMTKLNLVNNKIENAYINKSFLLNTNLQTLDLTGNHISVINDTDLENLKNTKLITLKIKMNNLQSITKMSFSHFKNSLKGLELERNQLLNSGIIENALKGLEGAFGMQYLDLKTCGLTYVSKHFLQPFFGSKLHQLDLSHNPELNSIDEDAFNGLGKVQVLHLENCKLSSSDTRFSSMDDLRKLYISGNALQSCPHRLPASLEIIELQSNDIRQILKDDFKSLTNLREINLQKNSILSIESESFSDLTNLVILNLGFNRLNKIDSNIFYRMRSLNLLNLENQIPCLATINSQSFHLLNLKSLELQSNCIKLSNTGSGLFEHVPQLTNLSLRANHLKELNDRLFESSGNIRFIDLSMNKISGWSPATFTPLVSSVVDINLKLNNLSFISYDSKSNNYLPGNFQSLRNLYLENNVWNCTCSNVIWMLHFEDKIPNKEKIICQYPNGKIGRKLFSIMKNCSDSIENPFVKTSSPPNINSRNSIIVLLMILFVIIGILFFVCFRKYRNKISRCFRKVKRYNHPYGRLGGSNDNDNSSGYNNPIQDDLIDIHEPNEVNGCLQFKNTDSVDLQNSEDQLSKDSSLLDIKIDIVVVSENNEFDVSNEKLTIRLYSNLSLLPDDWRIIQMCDCLVIDSLFSDFETLGNILNTRRNNTFIFYNSDDSIVNIQNIYPESEYLKYKCYDGENIMDLYYRILN